MRESVLEGVRSQRSRRWRFTAWLAMRSAWPLRADVVVRVVVGAITAMLVLTCGALHPTALNVSNRLADSVPQFSPRDARDAGILAESRSEYYEGHDVRVLRVAPVGDTTDYEGVEIPAPGQMLASPAAVELLAGSPELKSRHPEHVAGDVPERYLLGPRHVVLWIAVEPREIDTEGGWLTENPVRNADLRTTVPDTLQLGYIVVVLGFVLPLVALAGILSALGSRRRQDTTAALALIGVRRGQLRVAGVLTDLVLFAVSVLLGTGLFVLVADRTHGILPFGEGIWRQDIEVDPVISAGILAIAWFVGAVATWRMSDGLNHKVSTARRRHRVVTVLAGLSLGSGVVLLTASQVAPLPDEVTSIPLIVAMPLCGLGLVGLLPAFVQRGSQPLTRGSAAAMWAGRVIQRDPGRAARTGTGLTMMLVVAGLLLMFFPLIADGNAAPLRALGEVVGESTLTTTGRADEGRKQWKRIQAQADASLKIVAYQPPNRAASVFFVDCGDLESLTGIDRDKCKRGLIADGGMMDLHPGDDVRLGGQAPWKIPMTATADLKALKLVRERFMAGGVILPAGSVAELPRADSAFYLARPRGGGTEPLRTQFMAIGGENDVLSIAERYAMSTFTTVQFTRLLWLAVGLSLLIASFATVLGIYDRVRATRPERRLLAIGGARRSFTARSLQLQTMVPLLICVPAATAVTWVISFCFARLSSDSGGIAGTPTAELLTLAGLCLVVPLLIGALVLRSESYRELLQTPE